MTPIRLSFSGPRLLRLYSDLRTEGLSRQDLDRGCPSILYSQVSPGPTRGAQDHRLIPCELFHTGLTRLGSSLFSPIYRRFSGEPLPWTVSPAFLTRFDEEVARWRRNHPESPGQSEGLVRTIYRWVTDPEHPTGLRMTVNPHVPERSAEEILQQTDPQGDCSEFAMLFYALLNRAGFSPEFRWIGVDRDGNEALHLVVETQAQNGSGGTTRLQLDAFYDPLLNPELPTATENYDPLHPGHQSSLPIDLGEVLGWYWNNRALERQGQWERASCPSQRRREAEATMALFDEALRIDPYNPHLWLNRGIFQGRLGLSTEARRDFLRTLQLDPDFAPAHYELGNLEFDRDRYRQAIPYYRRAVQLAPEDPDYLQNLSLALIRAPSFSSF